MDLIRAISSQASIRVEQAAAAVELLDAGNTIPFIARYRKEATRGLDEEQLRQIAEAAARLRSLEEQRQVILKSIRDQGKLTSELQAAIEAADTHTMLDDLYQPYRPKRRTRAGMARERGLQPLADLILAQIIEIADLNQLASAYLSDEVPGVEDAWAGAMDIVAEAISDHADIRRIVREKALQWGLVRSEKIDNAPDEKRVYELYYNFELRADRLRPHQILAINRGEAENILRVRLTVPERDWRSAIEAVYRSDRRSPLAQHLERAAADGAERLLLPAIERDVRRSLTEKAEAHAIGVFAENLRALLSQPPLVGQTIIGIDPGFRTGCKAAVIDPTGKLLDTATIYPHEPQKRFEEALEILVRLVRRYGANLIAIGNGTASRETEKLTAELIHRLRIGGVDEPAAVKYLIVNEAGASVYSASPLARAEMPDLDVSLRGAVSIARRAQDPLAELVKIDPKAIGVGLYQHDVNQKRLESTLDGVVESVVNSVGVDLNTASPALLTHVAGIGPKLAESIVQHRTFGGPYESREALKRVPGLGPKAFQQSAGFLRIRDGGNPLDASAIHPESYAAAEAVMRLAGIEANTPADERQAALDALIRQNPVGRLAEELGTGEPTLLDILEQLARPGRDPRRDAPPPLLRSDVLSVEDLKVGMRLKGTVRNVVDFGAFVDVGVKQDGLLHRSEIRPGTVIKVGEILEVEVRQVEADRGRISLGMVE